MAQNKRPKDYEEAKKQVRAYINKLNYEYRKQQLKEEEGKKLTSNTKKKNYKKIKYVCY